MYVIRLSYEPHAGMSGDAALASAREFNRRWVAYGMPQMRILLSPFGQFGAPFVELDVTLDDLGEAEEALTRLRAALDSRGAGTTPAPSVEILRVLEEPPIQEAEIARTLAAAPLTPPAQPHPSAAERDEQDEIEEATRAAIRAQDAGAE